MRAFLVYTAPYLYYGGAGFVIFYIKKSEVIAHTFNFGGLLLLLTWLGVIINRVMTTGPLEERLSIALSDNFLFSAIVAGVFFAVLGSEAYLTTRSD